MNEKTDNELSVDTAISRVLDAERDALARIADCEKRADGIMRESRQVIRNMVRRTGERISRLHAGCARRNADLVAELEAAARAGEQKPVRKESPKDQLRAAVAVAARRLTTLEPDGVD